MTTQNKILRMIQNYTGIPLQLQRTATLAASSGQHTVKSSATLAAQQGTATPSTAGCADSTARTRDCQQWQKTGDALTHLWTTYLGQLSQHCLFYSSKSYWSCKGKIRFSSGLVTKPTKPLRMRESDSIGMLLMQYVSAAHALQEAPSPSTVLYCLKICLHGRASMPGCSCTLMSSLSK